MTVEMRAYRGPTRKTKPPKVRSGGGGNSGTSGCFTVLVLFVAVEVSLGSAVALTYWWLS